MDAEKDKPLKVGKKYKLVEAKTQIITIKRRLSR
jgi:hypothetical protein